jgi:hypothetical protein
LEHEVRREDGFLERGELRAREGAVRGYPADEGLEEGGAEEGAIAVAKLVGVMRWMEAMEVPENVVCCR